MLYRLILCAHKFNQTLQNGNFDNGRFQVDISRRPVIQSPSFRIQIPFTWGIKLFEDIFNIEE